MKLAVVGNPITHSKSPLIFKFLFDEVNVEYSYERILLNSAKEISELFEEGYSGINITAPFKQSIIPLLDELSEEAKQIGSVNTVVLNENKLIGYNTDYLGIVNALEANAIDLSSKKCLILGAGGAARAAVFALKNRNASVQIYNRSEDKAKALAEDFNVRYVKYDSLEKAASESVILIDTLPSDVKIIKDHWLHSNFTVLDASYPKSVYDASKIGKLIGGEHWLLHQALPAFEIFTGIDLNKRKYDQQALLNLLVKS